MRRLDLSGADSGLRARRWDAIVLGGALPGLLAAARLGRHGLRVLVVEEEMAARLPAPLREPFFLGTSGLDGLLDSCLSSIGVTLRDRRRIEPDELAYQVVLPKARVDVGGLEHTASELVVWGLAKPEEARHWIESVARAGQAERAKLLQAPLVRRGGLRSLARGRGGGRPQAAESSTLDRHATPRMRPWVRAQLRSLSHLDRAELPPEAVACLLGAALGGGARIRSGDLLLRRLVQRRVEALHGELRTVAGSFELVHVDPHPGLLVPRTREVWLGRALILNAPCGLLAAALRAADQPVPEFLDAPLPARRRIAVHLRCEAQAIPEGMAHRVIRVLDPDGNEDRVVTIARHPGRAPREPVHLVGRSIVGGDRADDEEAAQIVRDAVTTLMPFCEDRVAVLDHARPLWDDEDVLTDPRPGSGWPGEVNIRVAGRLPIFTLPREETGALGLDGELLLGWRAGDAIAEELR
jgi:hypothetical protein